MIVRAWHNAGHSQRAITREPNIDRRKVAAVGPDSATALLIAAGDDPAGCVRKHHSRPCQPGRSILRQGQPSPP